MNSSNACDSFVPLIRCLRTDGSWPAEHQEALVRQLRDYLHQVCHSLGLSTRIVPHQLRHTYATEMLRAGVSFPALMKLLGHTSPEMTMRYLEVALNDLHLEFQLARSKPRHLVPQPKTPFARRTGLDGVIDSLLAAQHLLEMFRRALPNDTSRSRLDRLSNRLTKIVIEARKLRHALRMGRDWPVKSANRKLAAAGKANASCPHPVLSSSIGSFEKLHKCPSDLSGEWQAELRRKAFAAHHSCPRSPPLKATTPGKETFEKARKTLSQASSGGSSQAQRNSAFGQDFVFLLGGVCPTMLLRSVPGCPLPSKERSEPFIFSLKLCITQADDSSKHAANKREVA